MGACGIERGKTCTQMNVLSHIQIKQVAYHFQFDKGLLTYFQGVA